MPWESLLPCKLKPWAVVHDETLTIESPERSRIDDCNVQDDDESDTGTLAHNVSNLNLFEVRDTMLEQMRFSNPDWGGVTSLRGTQISNPQSKTDQQEFAISEPLPEEIQSSQEFWDNSELQNLQMCHTFEEVPFEEHHPSPRQIEEVKQAQPAESKLDKLVTKVNMFDMPGSQPVDDTQIAGGVSSREPHEYEEDKELMSEQSGSEENELHKMHML